MSDRLDNILAQCREKGMRRTKLLRGTLTFLLTQNEPVSIQQILSEINEDCDPASLYRLLHKLETLSIVRRIGLHDRAAHFLLTGGSEHHDYVVCTECGKVQPLGMDCPVHQLEKTVSRETGFSEVYHELQFYGCCPDCVHGN